MKKSTVYLLIAMFSFIAGSPLLMAQVRQYDDPNLDQIPYYIRQSLPVTTDAPLASVITIGNWDNFNLGIDFAENNMSCHPSKPTWFFTAYNTNGTHHTENGFDWYINNPNFGTTVAGDPVSAYDSLGNLYYENMYPSGSIQGCKVVKSTNNGATWGPAVTAIMGNDKNWIAADQTAGPYSNYVYTTMTNNSVGSFYRSIDQGASFQSTFSPTTQNLPGMMVCVGPNGNVQGGSVYVVTNGGSTFSPTYTFYRSTDGGSTFTNMGGQQFAGYVGTNVSNRHSVQGMRTRPYPFIAADNSFGPHRGRLYCVYASNDPPGNGNKPDIWLRYSDDGGDNWSTAKKVNDDPSTNLNHQWHPAIWCEKSNGRLYIMWMDTRDTPTSDSALIYATYTDDGGASFVANQMISNKKMKINCTTCGGGGTPRYQGDYNGIVSNPKVSMAGWADFRNGTFMSTVAYFPDFAMAIDHDRDTLYTVSDSATFMVSIPEVKLYSDTVLLSANVNPVPTAGTITFSFPQGYVITQFPNALPVNVVLNGEVPLGLYQVIFTAAGPNGTPVHKRTAMVRILQGNTFMVNATADPGTFCQGQSTQLNATVTGGTAPFTYAWSPSEGLSDTTIANPVASPMSNITYHVVVTDAAMNTAEDDVSLIVNTAPETPGAISGELEVCKDSVRVYTVAEVIGATSYSWTVPSDATIISGQNTNIITVQWGAESGNISVIAGNSCGNSNPSVVSVAVSMTPDMPGTISGPSMACQGITFNFAVDEVPGATGYTWSVPADVTINSGQGTHQLNVTWGSTAGDVSVTAWNFCGMSPEKSVSVSVGTLPEPAGTVSGPDSVCQNHGNYIFSIPEISNATGYLWSLPPGAEITAGDNTREITVYFSPQSQSGMLSVSGVNDCGQGDSSEKNVIVNPCAGMAENNLLSDVLIYPNPASDKLNVSVSGKEKQLLIQITDARGNIIFRELIQTGSGNLIYTVDIRNYADGLYFVRLSNGQRSFVQKVLVGKK